MTDIEKTFLPLEQLRFSQKDRKRNTSLCTIQQYNFSATNANYSKIFLYKVSTFFKACRYTIVI